jgi:hypothetical protein
VLDRDRASYWRTVRTSDSAPVIHSMKSKCHRGVRCVRLLACILRDSLEPLSAATTSNHNPVVVTRKVYVPNPPFLKQRIPAPDGDGIRIHCNNLILRNFFVASVIRVKSRACVVKGEMAEDTGKFLALLHRPTSTPNPILEGKPSVGAPCAEEPLVCFWFARWHFTSNARCRLTIEFSGRPQ